jgi:hypothetical protein
MMNSVTTIEIMIIINFAIISVAMLISVKDSNAKFMTKLRVGSGFGAIAKIFTIIY